MRSGKGRMTSLLIGVILAVLLIGTSWLLDILLRCMGLTTNLREVASGYLMSALLTIYLVTLWKFRSEGERFLAIFVVIGLLLVTAAWVSSISHTSDFPRDAGERLKFGSALGAAVVLSAFVILGLVRIVRDVSPNRSHRRSRGAKR
jgi:hypothetical protein